MRVTNEERITTSADDIDAAREPAQAGRQPIEEPDTSPEQDQRALEEEGYGYGV